MIAHLRGTLAAKLPGEVVVDVGGTGYQVFVSLNTFCELPHPGGQVSLSIYTHVRENALQLFGFLDRREKQVFELLLGVSGIGPRLATNVLSGIPAQEMVHALTDGDTARLMAIPGVGRKLAERLTVELKERAGALRGAGGDATNAAWSEGDDGTPRDLRAQAISALVNLGYRRPEAERAVKDAARPAKGSLEETIRMALRSIAG
jgi:Holliday junction DNA helicase RuvA